MEKIAINDRNLHDRREAIRLDEENKALREFVEMIANYSERYERQARELLQKWAKPEVK